MQQVTLEEAMVSLPELAQAAANGEEIVIQGNNFVTAKLVPYPTPVEAQPLQPRPQFGSAKGLISMSDDFDAPLEDFKDYM